MTKIILFFCALSSAAAFADFSANVFEGDRRTEVTNTKAPWSAIGKLVGPAGSCTATLISRNIIVTGAHCIMMKGAFVQGDFRFYPQYSRGVTVQSRLNHFWWGTTTPENNRGQDWALGRLDDNLGDTQGWLGVRSLDGSELLTSHNYYMGAYSSDFQQGEVASWESGFVFTEFFPNEGFLLHNGDMSRGASGASIFYYDDENAPRSSGHVVALNVAEYRDGGDVSLKGIPFTRDHANIAVPATAFYSTFLQIK